MLGMSVLFLPLVTGLRQESLTVTGRLTFVVYFVLLNVLLAVLYHNHQARFKVGDRAGLHNMTAPILALALAPDPQLSERTSLVSNGRMRVQSI